MEENKKRAKVVGEGVGFDRIRRITGYLVGTLDRFNNAKKAEVGDKDFVKTGEGNIDTQPAEPSSKISVLGNEAAKGEPANAEEEFVMNHLYKI